MPDIWLISGIPGAGKTTTAKALAQTFPNSALIHGDAVHELMVGGRVPPGERPKREGGQQLDLCVQNQCVLASSFYDYGVSPVLDWVVADTRRLRMYQQYLRPHPIHFVTLDVRKETALRRDAGREEQVASRWLYLQDGMRTQLAQMGYWLKTDELSVEEVVENILENKDKALVSTLK